MESPSSVLIIQTASIGDVILATPLIESLKRHAPDTAVDFLLKRENQSLFAGHPLLRKLITWDKGSSKYRNLLAIIRTVRKNKYDLVINLHRFAASGLVTVMSGAGMTVGFDKNPFSIFYKRKARHTIRAGNFHEIDRNLSLLASAGLPVHRYARLYPSGHDMESVAALKSVPYLCLAPASLWFTKQYPLEKWVEMLKKLPEEFPVFLLGSANDHELCKDIAAQSGHPGVQNLAGKLSLLQTAALMKDAKMNFVNDSAPLHLASAVNAPVTAIFCSTVAGFGFGPLSEDAVVVETRKELACRPCGLHGRRQCPEKHFDCAMTINTSELLNRL